MTDSTDETATATSSPEAAQTSRGHVSDDPSLNWTCSADRLSEPVFLLSLAGLLRDRLPGVHRLTEAESQALGAGDPNDPQKQRLLVELGRELGLEIPRIEPGLNPSSTPHPSIVQIEAAKLRLVTDRRLGKKSPEWLKRVAKGLPAQPEKTTANTGPSRG